MARTTATPLKSAPSGVASTTVTTGASAWLPGAWVEFIASASTDLQIAGVMVDAVSANVQGEAQVEVGIGAAAAESSVATVRFHWTNSGSIDLPAVLLLPLPLDVIPTGSRVALRVAQKTPSAQNFAAVLLYYEALDSDHVTTGTLSCLPVSADGAVVTPNSTGWANSSWVELTAALAGSADLLGLTWTVASGPAQVDIEFDLGTGTAGAETVLTTLRTAQLSDNLGYIKMAWLPVPHPVAAGERLAVRMRKGGTSTTTFSVAALLVTPSAVPVDATPVEICGARTVYAWVELQTDDGVKRYAKTPLAIDDEFKDGRVSSFGTIRRSFSRERGGYETATATIELVDTDRSLRGLASTGTLLNKRCDIYLSTDEGMRAGHTPRRVMQGLVRRYKPLPGLKFRIELEDFFGSRFSHFSGDRLMPGRVFNVDDFPNLANAVDDAGNEGNPTLVGKAVPIAYGELSDEGESDEVGVVPCHYVGKRIVNSFLWDEYVVCGHAIKEIYSWFAAASEDAYDLPREKMPPDTEGVDFLIPGFAGWATHVGTSDMFRDFNGRRYTVIYARGPRSDAAREGKVPFTLNISATEDVGDGTGNTIVALPFQIEHLIVQWMLQTYDTGDWAAVPEIGDPPYEQFLTTSTDAVDLIAQARSSPAVQYQGAFMLAWEGQFHVVRELVADICRSCDIDLGLNKDGQLFMSMVDPDAVSVKDWSDVVDVLKDSLDIDQDFDRLANRIEYRYRRNYIQTETQLLDTVGSSGSPQDNVRLPESLRAPAVEWLVDDQAQEDATSIANHSETRIYDLDLPLVRDMATADNVIAHLLARLKNGPIHATFKVNLCGTDVENGDNETLDHYGGLSATGWIDRLLRNESHELNLDALEVQLVARDLGGLVD